MDLTVLGTGSADGWPNPHCGCAACAGARRDGVLRGQSAALLDGRLLLDCGPDTPAAVQRAGRDLTGLRHVLLTHLHPDHCAPAFLLFRSWVDQGAGGAPLDVAGPPEVVDQARRWVAPDSTVRFLEVRAGERHRLGGYDVRVHAARHGAVGSSVLYDVSAPGGRLLYATDTGPLPEATVAALAGAALDVVLLEETFGDRIDHGTDHLDLASFPDQLRRLRAVGALTPATDVVAIHLSHHNPPTAELARRLAGWGARVVADGTSLAQPASVPDPAPRRTLVLGGARSGKSREAERLLAAADDVTYVATAYPAGADAEWAERVRLHRDRRPRHWRTLETTDLVSLLAEPGGPLLVDCLTLWLTRVLDAHDAWDDEVWEGTGRAGVAAELAELVRAWRTTRRRVVAVSNEVGQGVVPGTAAGRRFRDLMGQVNDRLATESDDVRWCVAGRVVPL